MAMSSVFKHCHQRNCRLNKYHNIDIFDKMTTDMNDDGRGVGLIKLAESLVLTTDWWTRPVNQ